MQRFHGAYNKKSDAEKKKAKRKGAYILFKAVGRGRRQFRYVVVTGSTVDKAAGFNFGSNKTKRRRRKAKK